MTEIPEHLLKRSKERRAAMGLGDGAGEGDGGDSGGAAPDASAAGPAPGSATPEATAPKSTAPAPLSRPEPPPPAKPLPAYVRAAHARRRIPFWAMPVVALLPLWAFIYANSVTTPEVSDEAITLGEEVYGACAGCHGGSGAGGTGAQLSGGEVLKTFPDPQAMMEWIHLGADEWTGTTGDAPYGDPAREGGAENTGTLPAKMPAFDLDATELAAVTRYVREELSGEATPDEATIGEYEVWAQDALDQAEKGVLIYKGGEKPSAERIKAVGGG